MLRCVTFGPLRPRVARELGVNRQTLSRAIKRSEHAPEAASLFPNTGIKPEKVVVTEQHMAIMREEAEKGGSLKSAAGRIGCNAWTFSQALRRSRFYGEAVALFPAMKRKRDEANRPGMGEQLDRSQLHVKAATMKWRQAA